VTTVQRWHRDEERPHSLVADVRAHQHNVVTHAVRSDTRGRAEKTVQLVGKTDQFVGKIQQWLRKKQ